jgi:hypothetical protein
MISKPGDERAFILFFLLHWQGYNYPELRVYKADKARMEEIFKPRG